MFEKMFAVAGYYAVVCNAFMHPVFHIMCDNTIKGAINKNKSFHLDAKIEEQFPVVTPKGAKSSRDKNYNFNVKRNAA